MKQIFYSIVFFALLFTSCQTEDNYEQIDTANRIIDLSVSMPEMANKSRISLTENEEDKRSLIAQWEENDILELCFVQKDKAYKVEAKLTSISDDNHSARFSFSIPKEIENGTFDLYGCVGGNGLDENNPRQINIVPDEPSKTNYKLNDIIDRNQIIYWFEKKDLEFGKTFNLNIELKHLGSLIALHIYNETDQLLSYYKKQFILNSTEGWVYSGQESKFDMEKQTYSVNANESVSFEDIFIDAGTTITLWKWVATTVKIPEQEIKVIDESNSNLLSSTNILTQRTSSPGNITHIWAKISSTTEISFTDSFELENKAADNTNDGDQYFSMNDIENWTGEGENYAAVVIEWQDGIEPDALVWGYRWSGDASGADMIMDIVKANSERMMLLTHLTGYGNTIAGLGYTPIINKDKHYLIYEDGEKHYPVDGIITTDAYNYDNWTSGNEDAHWASGWFTKGYWSYHTKDSRLESHEYSSVGATSRELKNGSWDIWVFSDFSGMTGTNPSEKYTPAPNN